MSLHPELEKGRVRTGDFGSDPSYGFNGFFCLWIEGERVKILASDGEGWEHVSVSLNDNPKRVPKYSIMCAVKQLFWGDDKWVVQFHPPASEYINNHGGCLHLWRCTNKEFPTPPSAMVGIKGLRLV